MLDTRTFVKPTAVFMFVLFCQNVCAGCASLHLASQFGHTPIVAFLVAKGDESTPDIQDKNGMTALMWAAYRVFGYVSEATAKQLTIHAFHVQVTSNSEGMVCQRETHFRWLY